MKLRKLLLTGLVAASAAGIVPVPAQAADCVPNVEQTTVDDKVIGRTCTDCGWVMIRGEAHKLFDCD
jgi:hypothetical protein